jgi:xanthine dehydrogenase accessory factor
MITAELAQRIDRLTAERDPFSVATVVRARHPTSVRPGDSALVLADGTIEGFVGGDCARASLRLHALRALETGEPLLLRLVPGDPQGDEGFEPGDREGEVVVERNPCLSGGSLEIFIEPRLPPPLMIVVGDSPIARALERAAATAGYYALRGDADEAAVPAGAAAVVVASHGEAEEGVLSDALAAGIPYVGLVASRRRGEAVRAALAVPDQLRAQLHTPAGLEIGARTPAEIAIAILAQVIAEHRAAPAIAPQDRAAHPVVQQSAAHPVAQDHRGATEAIDPVCGMRVAISDATPRLGEAFFCSEHCREAYAQQHDVAVP